MYYRIIKYNISKQIKEGLKTIENLDKKLISLGEAPSHSIPKYKAKIKNIKDQNEIGSKSSLTNTTKTTNSSRRNKGMSSMKKSKSFC